MRLTRIALMALAAMVGSAQDRPGDARRGSLLFEQQRCVLCHSVNGVGGSGAPDLARRPTRDFTPSLLAASMWNHAPAMWRAMAAHSVPVPRLEPGDVADLFAYFHSLRYFDPPGDAARGKAVYESMCSQCHGPRAVLVGPPIARWRATTDSIQWVQQMWNHTSRMVREAEQRGIRWPRLTAQQMVDLMVYAQNLPGARLEPPTLRVGDPAAGEKLFELQGCARCHTVGGGSGHGSIDLARRTARFRTLTEFAATMWNHAPDMRRRAAQLSTDLLVFERDEMSDLLAYLFEKRYFDEPGNARRGAGVYRARHCGVCHESGQAGAPALAQLRGRFSAQFVTSSLWKHGPQMLAEMEKRGMKWPLFTNTEISDLIAHLNR